MLDGAVTTHLVNSTVIALHHIDGSDSIIVATEESVKIIIACLYIPKSFHGEIVQLCRHYAYYIHALCI